MRLDRKLGTGTEMSIRALLLDIAAQWPSYAANKTTYRTAPAYELVTKNPK